MKKVLGIVAGIFLASSMWAEDVYAIFNAEAVKDANLNLAASGIVSSILVDVDSEVKQGDLLLTLFNQDVESQMQSTEQQYIFAKRQYERYKRSAGAVDRNTLDRYFSEFKKLEADFNYQRALLSNPRSFSP